MKIQESSGPETFKKKKKKGNIFTKTYIRGAISNSEQEKHYENRIYKRPVPTTDRGTNVRTKLHYNKQLKSNTSWIYITNIHKTYKHFIETTELNGKCPLAGAN